MSEQRATYLAIAITGILFVLLYGFFVSEWVRIAVAAVITLVFGGAIVGCVYFGIRDALLGRSGTAEDPYAHWEDW